MPQTVKHYKAKEIETILELLYATGLRISELTNLKLNQIDIVEGIVKVMGKGGKGKNYPYRRNCTCVVSQLY